MELASAAKAAKTMLSMQAPHQASVDSNVPQVAAQAANHAAGTQQPRPAAHTQQSRANAAGEQQPGPSRLSAVEPEPSTPFPEWSESDSEEQEYPLDSEDEALLAPGQLSGLSSSSSDETEVNTITFNI